MTQGPPKPKVPKEPEFDSPLKGMKWDQMNIAQRVQALMSTGKDAKGFQNMAQKATQDLTKAADEGSMELDRTSESGMDRRKPQEIDLMGRTYNIGYLMDALNLKKDKSKNQEEDLMSAYDSELLVGNADNTKIHNHTRPSRKFKHAMEVESNNSGEAPSLDYALRNVDGMKRHMRAANIGKTLPGKKHKKPYETDKTAALVGYFLAGLIKSGAAIPDFEKSPELLLPFLDGFHKAAGLFDAIRSFVCAASKGMDPGYQTPPALQNMIDMKPTAYSMNKALVPPGGPTITAPKPNVMAQRATGNKAPGQ